MERLSFRAFYTRLLPLVGVGTFFDGFDTGAMSSASAVIISTLAISKALIGFVISINYLGMLAGALFFGAVAESWGRKRVFVTCLAIYGVFSIATAFAWNFDSILVFRILQGIGLGGEVPVAATIVNEFVRGKNRGTMVNLYEWLFALAIPFPPLLLAIFSVLVPHALSWRFVLGVGGFPLLWALVAWWKLPESPRWLVDHNRLDHAEAVVKAGESREIARGVTLAEPVVRPSVSVDVKKTRLAELFGKDYRKTTYVQYSAWFSQYFISFNALTPILFVTYAHVPLVHALILVTQLGLIQITVLFFESLLTDKVGRKPLIGGGFAISVAAAVIGYFVISSSASLTASEIFAIAVFFSFGTFPALGLYSWTPESYPTRMRAWATSSATSFNRIGAFLGPVIAAFLLSLGKSGILDWLLLIACVTAYGCIVTLAFGTETKHKILEEISK